MGKTFGDYLKRLREERKMTLRNVEETASISNAYLSQVESGQRNIPTMKILSKLAKAYGVPITSLMNKAEEELKGQKGKQDEKIPPPDTEFICRGYEKLSEESKQALKKALQHLQRDDKEIK